MSNDSAKTLLAEALEVEPASLARDATMENCEAWTSVAHLRLILALEEKLGLQLGPDEALEIQSLADVARLLERHRPA